MWCQNGKPQAAVNITQAQFEAFLPRLSDVIAKYQTLSTMARSQRVGALPAGGGQRPLNPFVIRFRASDILTADQYNDLEAANAGLASYGEFGQKFVAMAEANPESMERFVKNSTMYTHLIVYNYLHRHYVTDHNCLTDDLRKPNTTSARLLKCYGALKDGAADWMERRGHDLFHSLTDETMTHLALALVTPATDEGGALINANVVVNRVTSTGNLSMKDAYRLSEAACDRCPAGNIGLGAMMVGLDCVAAMIGHLGMKVEATTGDLSSVCVAVDEIKEWIGDVIRVRDEITTTKDMIKKSVVCAAGYCYAVSSLRPITENHDSLSSLVASESADHAKGKAIGEYFDRVAVDQGALTKCINIMIAAVDRVAVHIGNTASNVVM
jgi:hypothetical protein